MHQLTAEQVANQVYCGYHNGMPQEEINEIVRSYGRQIGKQALKDAAERASNYDDGHDSKKSILNTEIKTP